jgi:pyrroloquinoline quinone biosynthesis protein B
MKLRVLGSAAGGGFPQWNCACRQCAAARLGRMRPRTQASLAVSADGERWLLLGVSPDIRAQIADAPALWPRPPRSSPIVGAALPNGDLDAWLGLLSLREDSPLTIYATRRVQRDLVERNEVLRTLARFPGQTRWLDLDEAVTIAGLELRAVPAPGKPPLHAQRPPDPLDNVGFLVRDGRSQVAWFPSVACPSHDIEQALADSDVIFFDGTFFCDDELGAAGLGRRRASEMAHWPVGGADGSARFLARFSAREKWLVHVNNSNPLLCDGDPARRGLVQMGIDVACDGLELEP